MSPRARGQGHTPHRHLRADDDIWLPFGAAVERAERPDRSTVLREFMAWYARLPGSKMPQRPPAAHPESD